MRAAKGLGMEQIERGRWYKLTDKDTKRKKYNRQQKEGRERETVRKRAIERGKKEREKERETRCCVVRLVFSAIVSSR